MTRDFLNTSARAAALLLVVGWMVAASAQSSPESVKASSQHVLVIHGGAGVPPPHEMTPEKEAAYRAGLERSLRAGHEILLKGGTSVAAVEAAIRVMEDSPLFNAGKGASFNSAGVNELDSAIMDGRTLAAGGVAIVQGVKNPITLARLAIWRRALPPAVVRASYPAESGIRRSSAPGPTRTMRRSQPLQPGLANM